MIHCKNDIAQQMFQLLKHVLAMTPIRHHSNQSMNVPELSRRYRGGGITITVAKMRWKLGHLSPLSRTIDG